MITMWGLVPSFDAAVAVKSGLMFNHPSFSISSAVVRVCQLFVVQISVVDSIAKFVALVGRRQSCQYALQLYVFLCSKHII